MVDYMCLLTSNQEYYVHIEFRLHLIKARNLGVCKVNDKKIPIQDLKKIPLFLWKHRRKSYSAWL